VPTVLLRGIPRENVPYIIATRVGLFGIFVIIMVLVRKAYRRKFGESK
jgi:hypothetical protein